MWEENLNLHEILIDEFNAVFNEKNPGDQPPALHPDTVLMQTGLDSLGLAIWIVRLESRLGYDPFQLSSDPFYPVVFSEFFKFYEKFYSE